MEFVKCIDDVVSEQGGIYFHKNRVYRQAYGGDEYWDEEGIAHAIGKQGEEWFDKHFQYLTDKETLELYSQYYADMPNHDKLETEKLQEHIEKKIEEAISPYKEFYNYFNSLYGEGLRVANWHLNGDLEPFDNFFEHAENKSGIK